MRAVALLSFAGSRHLRLRSSIRLRRGLRGVRRHGLPQRLARPGRTRADEAVGGHHPLDHVPEHRDPRTAPDPDGDRGSPGPGLQRAIRADEPGRAAEPGRTQPEERAVWARARAAKAKRVVVAGSIASIMTTGCVRVVPRRDRSSVPRPPHPRPSTAPSSARSPARPPPIVRPSAARPPPIVRPSAEAVSAHRENRDLR